MARGCAGVVMIVLEVALVIVVLSFAKKAIFSALVYHINVGVGICVGGGGFSGVGGGGCSGNNCSREAVLIRVLSLAKNDSPWSICLFYHINVDDNVGNCIWHGVHFCCVI